MSFVSDKRRLELELFLLTAQPRLDNTDSERFVRLCRENPDWPFLIKLVKEHRLTPLLYKHIDDLPAYVMPEEHRERLEQLFLQNTTRATFLVDALHRVMDLLKDHEIAALALKGPVLAVDVYEDPSWRQFDDLDILVRAVDIPRVREALAEGGFFPELSLTARQTRAYVRSQRDWVYTNAAKDILVDINSAVSPRHFSAGPRVVELIRSSVKVTVGGRELATPCPEDMLLILCIHGCYHFWQRLSWITDVAALVAAHPGMDWESIVSQAARSRCYRMLGVGLLTAADLLQADIPEPVLEPFRRDDRIGALLLKIYTRTRDSRSLFKEASDKSRIRRLTRDSMTDWLRDLASAYVFPTVGDWKAVSLPDKFFPLYYALRPFRLTGKLIRGVRRETEEEEDPQE